MKSNLYFTFNDNGREQQPDVLFFSGGEVHLSVDEAGFCKGSISSVEVFVKLQDSDGIMALLMLTNALKIALGSSKDIFYTLHIGYFPYARQDRVCNPGEAFADKVMANLINSLEYDKVIVTDPHSDVTPAMLNYCETFSVTDIFLSNKSLADLVNWNVDALVIPDAGAAKKVNHLACKFEIETLQCHKIRDTANGNITGTTFMGDVVDKDLLIVDDICDRGGTFIALAKLLKESGARSVSLYVTHCILPDGPDKVLEHVDEIYCTDTINHGIVHENLHIINI